MLFADNTPPTPPDVPGAVWLAIGSVITGVIGAIVAAIIKLTQNWNAQSKQKRKDTIGELHELITRLQRDRDDDRRRMDEMQKTHEDRLSEMQETIDEAVRREADCQRNYARAESRIEALEEVLTNKGIKFRPWSPNPQTGLSDRYPALPPDAGKDKDKKEDRK